MTRVCTVCTCPEREAIDQALVSGEPPGSVKARYGSLSLSAMKRHKAEHLPITLARAQAAREIANADDLLRQANEWHQHAVDIYAQAKAAGALGLALAAVREGRGTLELLARLLHEIDAAPQVNILVAPEWLVVRAAIISALSPYPEARAAVAGSLLRLEAGAGNGHGHEFSD